MRRLKDSEKSIEYAFVSVHVNAALYFFYPYLMKVYVFI